MSAIALSMKASLVALALFSLSSWCLAEEPLTVGGSTTLLPVISAAASDFMEKYETWDEVDPALPAEPIVVFVTGGGSSFGVKSVLNGTVDIGLVSRELKTKEADSLGEHKTSLVGKDCVAIAVSKKNPASKLKGITRAQTAALFSGQLKTYSELDATLPPTPIVLLVRDAGAGSSEIMQDVILGKASFSSSALQLPSQGALLKKLESNENAIAYISSGLVNESESLKALELDGVAPSNENVINGTYPLSRPLMLVVKGKPDVKTRKFIDYVLGEGQKLVIASGYVPVHPVQ